MQPEQTQEIHRCSWAQGDPVMAAYHDVEWGVPVRDGRALWEMLVLEGFQAGLSWRTILHRREGFRRAFEGFSPERIAAYDAAKVDALMQDDGIIRARAKIEATISNARAFLDMGSDMESAGEGFSRFAWGFFEAGPCMGDGLTVPARTPASEAVSAALKRKGFKFVGPVIVYAWMQAVGMINDHTSDCPRRAAIASGRF